MQEKTTQRGASSAGIETKAASGPSPVALSFRTNFGWTFAGSMAHAVCSWGMLAVLAKTGSADVVGTFALGLAVAAPVTAIAMMQLRLVQATDSTGEYAFCEYFGTRIVTTALGLGIITAIALFGSFASETAWVVFAVGIAKSLECVSEVVRGLFQRHERMNISGRSLMMRGPLALAALAIIFTTTQSLVAGVAGMAVVTLAVLAFHDLPFAARLLAQRFDPESRFRRLAPSFDRRIVARLVLRALPLGIGALLLAVQANLPRYFLEALQGSAALGFYAAMAYVAVAGSMVVSALGQSAAPRLAVLFQNDVRGYVRLLKKLLGLGLGLGVVFIAGIVMVGPWVLTILYREEYANHQTEFVLIAIAAALMFLSNFSGFALTATRVFRVQLIAGIVTCITAGVCCFMLIPRFAMRGAAVTAIITSGVLLCCYLTGILLLVRAQRRRLSA